MQNFLSVLGRCPLKNTSALWRFPCNMWIITLEDAGWEVQLLSLSDNAELLSWKWLICNYVMLSQRIRIDRASAILITWLSQSAKLILIPKCKTIIYLSAKIKVHCKYYMDTLSIAIFLFLSYKWMTNVCMVWHGSCYIPVRSMDDFWMFRH